MQPQFADKCPWRQLGGSDWRQLLSMQPQFADTCCWRKLESIDWSRLLKAQPQFADKCPDWFDRLVYQPGLAAVFDDWNKIARSDWPTLLAAQPVLAEKFGRWERIRSWSWPSLLVAQPQFADRCERWAKFDSHDWCSILRVHPEFLEIYRSMELPPDCCCALKQTQEISGTVSRKPRRRSPRDSDEVDGINRTPGIPISIPQ